MGGHAHCHINLKVKYLVKDWLARFNGHLGLFKREKRQKTERTRTTIKATTQSSVCIDTQSD
jgi:hypothetical protein